MNKRSTWETIKCWAYRLCILITGSATLFIASIIIYGEATKIDYVDGPLKITKIGNCTGGEHRVLCKALSGSRIIEAEDTLVEGIEVYRECGIYYSSRVECERWVTSEPSGLSKSEAWNEYERRKN